MLSERSQMERTTRGAGPEEGMWTPSAPAANATSARALISNLPRRGGAAREEARLHRSRASRSFSRSCTMSTPASKASRTRASRGTGQLCRSVM